ncbi:MAG: biopolymer transporter ExbD [Zoogloeaceae bacterium]|jgi:biopolymer transport protein ExbD|nr:biopolymer transporter ExbD [Zoogloeaceae bacterium]
MNFSRQRNREDPEINLIPLIDVLLVVIIFLMLTTTYSRFAGLEITLPSAEADPAQNLSNEIEVAITADGQVRVNKQLLRANDVRFISEALKLAAASQADPIIVISADAKASHQSVIDVMQAAQAAGYPRISFTIQTPPPSL